MTRGRRLILLILIALLAGYAWKRYQRMYPARIAEQFTPAELPKLNLEDVKVLAAMDAEYTKVVESVVPSVVSITSSGKIRQPLPLTLQDMILGRQRTQSSTSTSLGSGVIVSKEGHILTNHHVVAGMSEIRVQLTDGRNEAAKLIGSDPKTDIALLRIDAKNVQALSLGDSDELRVGQMVLAVGNPFGLEESVSRGIISAKGRRSGSDSGVEYIQTDAAVNQGNSGGPLINIRGEVVGINTAILSESGAWLGISFAVPSNTAKRVMEGIIKRGHVVRPWIGVNLQELTPKLAEDFGIPDARGALITDVMTGSPAEIAGLQPGDVLRKFNGGNVDTPMNLRSLVGKVDPGNVVELVIFRGGREHKVLVKIMEAP